MEVERESHRILLWEGLNRDLKELLMLCVSLLNELAFLFWNDLYMIWVWKSRILFLFSEIFIFYFVRKVKAERFLYQSHEFASTSSTYNRLYYLFLFGRNLFSDSSTYIWLMYWEAPILWNLLFFCKSSLLAVNSIFFILIMIGFEHIDLHLRAYWIIHPWNHCTSID